MSNLALIVDSACTLPDKVLHKYHINRVPLKCYVNGASFLDPCNEKDTLRLFNSGALKRKHNVTTNPPTVEDFEQQIWQCIKGGSEFVILQTVNRMQGETYKNANIAVSQVKQKLGPNQKVTLRVMDSRTVFAGQGLMALETLRQMTSLRDPVKVRREMDRISTKIHTFILPRDPLVAMERASARNEKAVGWTQAFIASTFGIHPIVCVVNDSSYAATKVFGFKKAAEQLFDHARNRIEAGLLCPFITINYGGPIDELKKLPGYFELDQCAKEHKIRIVPSMASAAGGIYTSVGSITLAMATEEHEW